MTMDEQQRNTGVPCSVFISYAHEDELLRQQLEAHLSVLRRQGLVATWQDRQIVPGTEWAEEIDVHLETARLVLLLISPDFLASEYCYGIEMRRALERHQNGEAQVIPLILRPVDWEGAPLAHLQCLPRDARAVTEWDNRDAAFRDVARGIRAAIEQLPSTSTQSQPTPAASGAAAAASTQATAVPTDRNRQRMLKQVDETWIAGVLKPSLHSAALMVLGLEKKADVLANPWRVVMQEMDRPAQLLPKGTRIIEIYNATEGGLLILGEPGAGKTTLLLELARDLLDRAQTSENAPIPVVFNLSSWAERRLALSDWLVEELSMRYEVPRRLGQSWVSEDRLLLLLDGLDEVASAARKECIAAINSYRQTHPDVQVVVCSRSTEYLNQPTQLRLHTAVVIQPLTQEQIDTYLESAGEQAGALREALRQDADLRELATTPLMLTILLFAYKGTSPDKISELTSLDAKREQLFASYVQHMLKRRGASKRYQPEQITHWLTYLARQMKQQNQTVFYLEQMQPDWLPKKWQRYVYRALAGGISGGLSGGLIGVAVGVLFSVIFVFSSAYFSFLANPIPWSTITAGLVIGLIIGQILGSLIGLFRPKSTEISIVEVITWSWANARPAAIASIVGGLLLALILVYSGNFFSNFLYNFFGSFDLQLIRKPVET
jgi:DNA polymerase III delta prime subunit